MTAAAVVGVGCGVKTYSNGPQADPSTDFTVVPGVMDAGGRDPDAAPPAAAMPLDAATPKDAALPADAAHPADAGKDAGKASADAMTASDAGATGAGGAGGGGNAGAGGAPPAPAAGRIVLNGTALAKEDVLAFIEIGHSNMEGRGTDPEELRAYNFTETDPHGWMYRTGSPPALAHEPLTGCTLPMCMMAAGPGTSLIKQAIELAPQKYFLSLGAGRNYATCSQFLPGALYFEDITKAAVALKDIVTFAGIVVMLGISERDADAPAFDACMTQLMAAVRNAVGQPDLPVLLSDYEVESTGDLAPGEAHANLMIPELHKLPSMISRCAIVPTDGLPMQDDHHFNLEGHKIWTRRLLDVMVKQGWFPWAPAAQPLPPAK